MKNLIAKGRLLLCTMIVLSFFLPAYAGYSALRFIPLALSEAADKSNVTTLDVLMLIVPLVLIPVIAFTILGLFLLRVAVMQSYLALPLLFMIFFLTLLFRSPGIAAAGGGLRGLQIGFYFMALSAVTLPFTKNAKQKSRRRTQSVAKTKMPERSKASF